MRWQSAFFDKGEIKMKKVFWPIVGAIILVALIFNAAYYGFGVAIDASYIVVAAAATVAVAATTAAATTAATTTAAFAAFAAFVVVTAFAFATAKEEGLSFARVMVAYFIEGAVIFFVLRIAPSSLLASVAIAAAGIGAAWCVCFLHCPTKFLCPHNPEEDPPPAA